MAIYGIISDVHGNLEALQQVLGFMRSRAVDRIVCLGDIVGYNAHSNECVQLIESAGIESIHGNHDLIAIGRLGLDRCADKPAFTLRRTRNDLTERTRDVLAALPASALVEDQAVMIHGGFADVCQYITTEARLLANQAMLKARHPSARICFFGHTHAPKLYELHRGVVADRSLDGWLDVGTQGRIWFVNPGAVDGSRRRGIKLAEFALFDTERLSIALHSIAYDHEQVERSARLHGYRMSALDEWLYATARFLRRGKRFAVRGLRSARSRMRRKGASC